MCPILINVITLLVSLILRTITELDSWAILVFSLSLNCGKIFFVRIDVNDFLEKPELSVADQIGLS